ncbi:MAG: alpha/beta hydrolase [Reyranella sp.]|uniref:alpha/beta fold hydrolase n=1 Tax=Reyranella sp. TaxID=1929291 RepID=UPI001AC15401|nr:alpha/beta hydrolase [Reyranella sp.]MBN9089079.1 alpha/beta hydrolase [Reyranella sp.]
MTAIKHSVVETRGFRAHVAEAGSGPTLLLLHGWPEFWATWEPMFERLADRYRLIAPDFRGFGESGNPDKGRTDQAGPDVLADDIAALMTALGIATAGFVGHDVGAYVMQRLAINHPDRAAGLFFFNCGTHGVGARWRDPRQINEIWYQTFHQMPFASELVGANRDACRAYFRHFLTHWSYAKDAFDGVLERWVDNFLRPGNLQGGFNWYVSQNAGRLAVMAGTAPKPPRIRQPARVFWGRHDPVLRSDWIEFVPDYFEDVEASIAEDAGHFVHYETPDPAAAEIDRFFRRIGYK